MRSLAVGCLVPAVLLALLCLALEASAKDPCSKDWLRFMVVSACGMDKRHLYRKKPTVAPSLKDILDEVDLEFDKWRLGLDDGPFESEEDNYLVGMVAPAAPPPSPKEERVDAADKQSNASDSDEVIISVSKTTFRRLSDHPDQMEADEWIGLVVKEPMQMRRRRAIQNAISRCCSEDCNEDAFEGVCD